MTHAEPHSFGYIRIDKCSDAYAWYSDIVGQTVPLRRPVSHDAESFCVWEDHPYWKLLNFVDKKDATVVDDKSYTRDTKSPCFTCK